MRPEQWEANKIEQGGAVLASASLGPEECEPLFCIGEERCWPKNAPAYVWLGRIGRISKRQNSAGTQGRQRRQRSIDCEQNANAAGLALPTGLDRTAA